MTKPSDHALNFEAVKLSLRQTKDGFALVLSLHPDDAPEQLFKSKIGARYMVALVELDDKDQPVVRPKEENRFEAVASDIVAYAGQLCRQDEFRLWTAHRSGRTPTEENAARYLHAFCGVHSRSELATQESSERLFQLMVRTYLDETKGL